MQQNSERTQDKDGTMDDERRRQSQEVATEGRQQEGWPGNA